MKIFNLTLTVLMLFILSCKNENKQDIKPDTVLEDVSLLDTLQLKLNAGDRWLANSETQEGVNKMDSLIEVFDTNTDKDFKKLGEALSKQTSYIIKNCTMKGEPHDQLHVVLVPMLDEISILRETNDSVEAETAYSKLKALINAYYKHFKL